MKITPTNGTRQYRKASLGLEGRDLVISDRKGTTRRFPLDEGPASPAESVTVFPEPMDAFRAQIVIQDGNGEALAITPLGDWDTIELTEFLKEAGLPERGENLAAPKQNLRHDGLVLEDGTWFKWVPAAGTLTLVATLLTGSGVLPGAIGWVIVLALAGYVAFAFVSGAFSKGRRGKGADQEEAFLATGDLSAFDDDPAAPPSNPKTEPPQPAT